MAAQRSYVPFLVLSPGRSGSNLLVSYLTSDPEVRCFGEVLNIGLETIDYLVEGYDGGSAADRSLRDSDPIAFLQQRIYGEHPESIRAVGFKAMYQHLPFFPALTGWLAGQQEIRVVHSKRRNLLRLFVSMRIAERTGQWIAPVMGSQSATPVWRKALQASARAARRARWAVRPPKPRLAETKAVTLSPEECQFAFTWLRERAGEYAERFRGHAMLGVYYEDLIADTKRTLGEVQDFLGLRPRPLTSGTSRQNPEPLRELLSNYDELSETFAKTEYAPFFDE